MIERLRVGDGVFVGLSTPYEIPRPRAGAPDVMDAETRRVFGAGATFAPDGEVRLTGAFSTEKFREWLHLAAETLDALDQEENR